jgi:bis(5'-adenosyl)-triphosphatase
VSPHRIVERLTDLTTDEITDLFTTVQKVQKMLARRFFGTLECEDVAEPTDGSFNIAIQDGPNAGQSVRHLHCHVIPRTRRDTGGDEIYERMASDEGNVGAGLWDRDHRPQGGGHFPKIEDADRKPRSAEDMAKEAQSFRELIIKMQL